MTLSIRFKTEIWSWHLLLSFSSSEFIEDPQRYLSFRVIFEQSLVELVLIFINSLKWYFSSQSISLSTIEMSPLLKDTKAVHLS